ncbi:MAG TPA: RidA family protein [Novosphingobium sp.]|nr:RidA family protein [Novosphingobium sp.]HZV08351.1 RidA family protein [Novosphingobium sp.]
MTIHRATPAVGYYDPAAFAAMGVSQMVSAGGMLHLSGVVAAADGACVSPGDLAGQVPVILDTIERLLATAGLDLSSLVTITCFTTDIAALAGQIPVFARRLGAHPPCSTWVEVKRLASPGYMLEIVAVAALA